VEDNPGRVCELLVGLGDVEVLGVGDGAGEPLGVHVRRRAPRPGCVSCGGRLCSDGEREVELVDLAVFGRAARLVAQAPLALRGRRLRGGHRDRAGPAGIAPERERLTTRARRWATRQSGRGRPHDDIARELGCSRHPVNAPVRRWGSALLAADTERISDVAALGLDEHPVAAGPVPGQGLGHRHRRRRAGPTVGHSSRPHRPSARSVAACAAAPLAGGRALGGA